MSIPIGVLVSDYGCRRDDFPLSMKTHGSGSHGSSFTFRKKRGLRNSSRDVSTTPSTTTSNNDPPGTASSLSPPSRPDTAFAYSRRGSRNSSVSSVHELNPTLFRQRSASIKKQASSSSEMLSQTTSRETSIRPAASTQNSSSLLLGPERLQPGGQALHRLQEIVERRKQTFHYFKKTHEGRVFWLNTLYYGRGDLTKLPYFDQQKLTRRATNCFILGNSIPAVLDPNADNLIEYLRAFNALMTEFETFSNLHPPDGTSSGAMSRVRMPRMFSRPSVPGAGKMRRSSGMDSLSIATNMEEATPAATYAPFGASERDNIGGEGYQFLSTPSLPFDPDYFETFASLCDTLIECYDKIYEHLISTDPLPPAVEDLFTKADTKVKKLLMDRLVRDFETGSKQSLRVEMAGLGKVVFGGLTG